MAIHRLDVFLEQVGGWEGYEVAQVTLEDELQPDAFGLPAPRIVIELQPKADGVVRCSRCGEPVTEIHDVSSRRVRDLPIMGRDTWLLVPRRRVACPRCGPSVEAVPWLDRYQRMTKRLAALIAEFARVLPLKQVAAIFGVSWDTVKQIDQRAMAARLGPIDAHWNAVRYLTIDEFAIERGHRYATVVVDPEAKRVLWVARGRDEGALAEFFATFGPARCMRIQAVAVDMWAPYAAQVRRSCPRAQLVYDLFHVVAKYGHEVIDRVRVDETNRIGQAAGPGPIRAQRRVIKGTRWLLLRNAVNLNRVERVRLRELLRVNRALFIVYVLKDDLKRLWQFRYPAAARRFWRDWRRRALASRIPALRRFVTLLERHLEGIISHCHYPLNTGLLEGINNKIKVLKRMAYGYRDDAYFFLKIRDAFPGIP
jgi:transposase